MRFNKHLISSILKNKIYLGSRGISRDLKSFISGINSQNGKAVFDTFKQINLIQKASLLLKRLKKQNKTILFFGVNRFGLDLKNKIRVLLTNKLIYDLCFSVKDSKDKKAIQDKINEFYNLIYQEKTDDFLSDYSNYEKFMTFLIQNKLVDLNGHFFDTWGGGLISNYHYLMPSLEKSFKEKIISEDPFFFDNLKGLKNLSFFLDDPKNFPGAVVFFSREGYDHFFKEFKKLGIPVICVVNSNESLKDIDFPLLGNNTSFSTIYFYQKIIKDSLKKI